MVPRNFNCSYFTLYVEKIPRNGSLSINLGNKNLIEEKNEITVSED